MGIGLLSGFGLKVAWLPGGAGAHDKRTVTSLHDCSYLITGPYLSGNRSIQAAIRGGVPTVEP